MSEGQDLFRRARGTVAAWAGLLGAALLLAGCAAGPKPEYHTPAVPSPAEFKESPDWKLAQPSDAAIRGKWWEIFEDTQLNQLEEQVESANQGVKEAEARFEEARAAIRIARSEKSPTVSVGGAVASSRQSENRPLRTPGSTTPTYYPEFIAPAQVSYEADFWGRIRENIKASKEQAQASAADLEVVKLALHAEVAADYFEMRGLDAEKQLLESTVSTYERALELTENRFRGGVTSEVDVAQAQTQLESTRAQAVDTEIQRSQLQHAIAVLIGKPASDFQLPVSPLATPPPQVPFGVPAQLLERRPDIAAAERRAAAANEEMGIARTAFFPRVFLSGIGGFDSRSFVKWFLASSSYWTVGPSIALTVLDGGKRRGVSEQAQAAFDQTVAAYKQSVLIAFQEVEDSLASLRILEDEAQKQQLAVTAADRSLTLSNNRYRGGVASYLEVTTAQNAALTSQRTALGILRRRMSAIVLLIKALGGGWNVSTLPTMN